MTFLVECGIVYLNKEYLSGGMIMGYNFNGTAALKSEKKIVPFVCKTADTDTKESQKKGNYKVGEKQEVYPFRSEEDLNAMHSYFVEHKQDRNDLMFIVGVNVGLRAGDLLSLRWDMVIEENGNVVAGVTVREEKTNKYRTFYFNDSCKRALLSYYESHHPERESYVFASQKGNNLNVRSACKILKTAAKSCGIKYNVGTHSLRKTFGYHQLKAHQDDAMFLCQLQKMFGHSSPEITLRYCGLESEKLQQYYNDINLL